MIKPLLNNKLMTTANFSSGINMKSKILITAFVFIVELLFVQQKGGIANITILNSKIPTSEHAVIICSSCLEYYMDEHISPRPLSISQGNTYYQLLKNLGLTSLRTGVEWPHETTFS